MTGFVIQGHKYEQTDVHYTEETSSLKNGDFLVKPTKLGIKKPENWR